jgi:anti-sigma regulatory factor (Ser/Thr protein kinase)
VTGECRLDLAPDADGAQMAAESARGLLLDADPESAFACELSVAEACANVVEHTSSSRLRIVIRRRPMAFSVAICDDGAPFTLPPVAGMPPPDATAGRGVALITGCMDRVRLVRVGDENRLLMARRIPAEAR